MHTCMSPDAREILLSRWDDVRFLLAALRDGSFTGAAVTLGTDQSTVSRRIAALEEALGVALFERARRAPLPTEAALRLREAAERIEAEMGRFTDEAIGIRTQTVSGRVRVALTEEIAIHFVIPKVLPRLRREHPELALDLVTGYRAADLVGREADVALRFFRTERGDLVGKRIARFATAVLASRSYARKARARPLRELDWIAVELPGLVAPETAWLEAQTGRAPVMVCSSYQVQVAAIRAGLGIGVGPHILAQLDRGFVALHRELPALPRLDLFLVTRRSIRPLPRITAVMKIFEESFAALVGA